MKNIVFLILCPLLLFSQTKKKETTIRNTYVTKFGEPQLKETQSYETSYSSDGKRIGGVTDKQWERTKEILKKNNSNDSIVITYNYHYIPNNHSSYDVYQQKQEQKYNPKVPATHFDKLENERWELTAYGYSEYQLLEFNSYQKVFTGSRVSSLGETYKHIKDYESSISEKSIFKYDLNNNNTSITVFNADGAIDAKFIKKFDSNNNIIEEIEYNGDGAISVRIISKYDSNNNMTEELYYDQEELERKTLKKYDAKNYNYETIKYSVFCETNQNGKKGDLYLDSYSYKRKMENGLVDKEVYYTEQEDCYGEIEAVCGWYPDLGSRHKYDKNGVLLEKKYYNITFYKGKPVLGSIHSKWKRNVVKDKNGYEIEIEDHYYTNKDGERLGTIYKSSIKKTDNSVIIKTFEEGFEGPEYFAKIITIKDEAGKVIEKRIYEVNPFDNEEWSDVFNDFSGNLEVFENALMWRKQVFEYSSEGDIEITKKSIYDIEHKYGEEQIILTEELITKTEYYDSLQ